MPRGRTALVLLLARGVLVGSQMMDMSGMAAGSMTTPMVPESTTADNHATSVVLDWNAIVRSLARGTPFGLWAFEDPDPGNTTSRFGTFLSPPLLPAAAARTFALVNVAMREALSPLLQPGASGALLGPGFGGVGVNELLDAVAFPGAAATFAAHYVLSHLYPNRKQAMFDAAAPGFDGVLARHISAAGYGLTGAWNNALAVAAAQRVGVAAGRLVVQLAAADGFDVYNGWAPSATAATAASSPPLQSYQLTGCGTPSLCIPINDTGLLRGADSPRSVGLPQAGSTVPLIIGVASDWTPAPPLLGAATYAQQLAWVRSVGEANSSARTPTQTDTAWFWSLGANTAGVTGLLTTVASQLLDAAAIGGMSSGAAGDLWRAADTMARLTTAVWDATIAATQAKYASATWRPETAVRMGGTRWWSPHLVNPPEPDSPSWHATACAAGAAVLTSMFGSNVTVRVVSENLRDSRGGSGGLSFARPSAAAFSAAVESGAFDEVAGIGMYAAAWNRLTLQSRTYPSFAVMAAECASSRVLAGVSFNYSIDAGQALGSRIGSWVAASYPGNLTHRGSQAGALVDALHRQLPYQGRAGSAVSLNVS